MLSIRIFYRRVPRPHSLRPFALDEVLVVFLFVLFSVGVWEGGKDECIGRRNHSPATAAFATGRSFAMFSGKSWGCFLLGWDWNVKLIPLLRAGMAVVVVEGG